MRPTKAAAAAIVVLSAVTIGYGLHHAPSASKPASPPSRAVVEAAPAAARVAPARPIRHIPTVPHDVVAPAAPTAFDMKGPAFDIKANVCGMENVRPLDPPGDQLHTVCWVSSGFGVAPGSKSGGTSYILGHAWAEAQLVLNPMSELASKQIDTNHPQLQDGVATFPVTRLNGYRVTLRTRNGTLTYVVRRAFAVAKEQAADVRALMANSPNRVVLITCAVANGMDLDYNIVAYAYLVSSLATAT